MLTYRALFEQHWGPFPFLGSVLEPLRQTFENAQYLTSVTDTYVDRVQRAVWTAALVSAHPDPLRSAVLTSADAGERARRARALFQDLRHLQEWLVTAERLVRQQREDLDRMTHDLMRDFESGLLPHGPKQGA